MLKAYLHPKKKPNDRHWYAYEVVFDGEIIVSDSRHLLPFSPRDRLHFRKGTRSCWGTRAHG